MNKLNQLLLIATLLITGNANAVELTPIFGYRGGGEFIDTDTQKKHTIHSSSMYGLIIGFPYGRGKDLEVYYSHQSSELRSINIIVADPVIPATQTTDNVTVPLTIDYLHIGGTAPIEETDDYKTFVSGGFGFTYLSPDFSGLQSDLRASISIGIGVRWPLSKNTSLRLETRGLGTLFDSNSTLFCNGGCSLTVNGNLFLQGEVFAGLAFRF
jgi:hypothetical protein